MAEEIKLNDDRWRATISSRKAALALGATLAVAGGVLLLASIHDATRSIAELSATSQHDDGYLDGYRAGPGRGRCIAEVGCERRMDTERPSTVAERSSLRRAHNGCACQY
jgi:hypothetical protein